MHVTGTDTRSARPASRSGCCDRTAPATSSSRTSPEPRRHRRPGCRRHHPRRDPLVDCVVVQNLAEEPGGAIFSMRRATVHRLDISGNLANDDGGGVYARRGGVEIYDSVLSNNLVDGSGGPSGRPATSSSSRSRVDGNTTDGDGGALYTDEAGDVTVIDSTIDGSTADGPGGAIFTLDGDVAIFGSTLNGNRADDRGGAISGEADVLVVNSTIARNLAVAHVGRRRLGARKPDGGQLDGHRQLRRGPGRRRPRRRQGRPGRIHRERQHRSGRRQHRRWRSLQLVRLRHRSGVHARGRTATPDPTRFSCRVYSIASLGYNLITDDSCGLNAASDVLDANGPRLAPLEDDAGGRVMWPLAGSPVLARIPTGECSCCASGRCRRHSCSTACELGRRLRPGPARRCARRRRARAPSVPSEGWSHETPKIDARRPRHRGDRLPAWSALSARRGSLDATRSAQSPTIGRAGQRAPRTPRWSQLAGAWTGWTGRSGSTSGSQAQMYRWWRCIRPLRTDQVGDRRARLGIRVRRARRHAEWTSGPALARTRGEGPARPAAAALRAGAGAA